jgi:hypothetical protein
MNRLISSEKIMTQSNVAVVDFKNPRDANGNIVLHPSVKELAKEIEKKAYDEALAKIIARAQESNW